MDCNASCTPASSCISRCPATSHLEHHQPHAEVLLHLLLVLANPIFLHDGFHSFPGVHPSCECSFDSFDSCGQACGEETLPTQLFLEVPHGRSTGARAVSSRPPGLRVQALISKGPSRSPRWFFLRSTLLLVPWEALEGKGKVSWVASSSKMPFFLESRKHELHDAVNFLP